TVRANIAYGRPDADEAAVVAAAEAAEAHEFITQLPEGYDTVVGERGLTLSGGQRQRVALARAILTDPQILVLDDATSSIDAKVEEEIHATLRRLLDGRTTLLVAHRRSTLRLADRIVVVDKGRVVDSGSHAELMADSPLYRTLLAGPGGRPRPEVHAAPLHTPVPGPPGRGPGARGARHACHAGRPHARAPGDRPGRPARLAAGADGGQRGLPRPHAARLARHVGLHP